MSRVRIPADVDREDQLLAGLTARQLMLLGIPGLLLFAAVRTAAPVLPPVLLAALLIPLAAVVVVVALARRDGLTADRFGLAAVRYLRSPRVQVHAPEGLSALPSWAAPIDRAAAPAPLRLPGQDIAADGIVELGAEGSALVCEVGTVNLALRTERETEALTAAYGRFLNSLTAGIQIVVRTEPVDLDGLSEQLDSNAARLPDPALEAAARDHARFLRDLAARRDVMRRRHLLVLRDPRPAAQAADALALRADEASSALAAAGIAVQPLDAAAATTVLASAACPEAPSHDPDWQRVITAAGQP